MKFLLLLLLPLNIYADVYTLTEEELAPESTDVLIERPEKFLRNESMIYDFNTDLGIKDQRRYTGTDRNRFSVAGHINGDYEQLGDLLGGELVYMRKSSWFNELWYGAQFFSHRSVFDAVTQNQKENSGEGDEANFQRPGDSKNSIMAFGLGVGYRFKFFLEFFDTEDVFETVDVFVNALQFKEEFIDENYRGYGLTTNYGFHKRSSTSYFYGGKISYNVGSVTREALANESKSDRSLSLGWLSFAFEMGFFF